MESCNRIICYDGHDGIWCQGGHSLSISEFLSLILALTYVVKFDGQMVSLDDKIETVAVTRLPFGTIRLQRRSTTVPTAKPTRKRRHTQQPTERATEKPTSRNVLRKTFRWYAHMEGTSKLLCGTLNFHEDWKVSESALVLSVGSYTFLSFDWVLRAPCSKFGCGTRWISNGDIERGST